MAGGVVGTIGIVAVDQSIAVIIDFIGALLNIWHRDGEVENIQDDAVTRHDLEFNQILSRKQSFKAVAIFEQRGTVVKGTIQQEIHGMFTGNRNTNCVQAKANDRR